MMEKRYRILALLVFALIPGFLLRDLVWPEIPGNSVIDRTSIRIVTNPWSGSAHAFIAEKKGIFSKNGVEVQLILVKTQSEAVAKYESGGAEGIFDIFLNTIGQIAKGIHSKVVYVIDYSLSGDVIVGRPELSSLADLKNRTVSFEGFNSFSHIYVLKALETVGLDESTVRFKMVPATEIIAALEQRRIDAGHTWQPTSGRALEKGYKILSRAGDIPGIITDVLSFHTKVVEQQAEQVRSIVKSLLEAQKYVEAHPEESLRIMAAATGMTVKEIAIGLDGIKKLNLVDNQFALSHPDDPRSLYNSGKFIIQFLLNRGQLMEIPNLNEIIDDSMLRSLK